jgi:UDP-N-acetylmuramoylalanine-D-glutamate ligase
VEIADGLAHLALGDAPAGAVATVLMSPAAASFDMFEDYAARGRAFIAAVGALAARREPRTTGNGRYG